MKILIIKSLFCPTKHYLDVTIKSIVKTNIFFNLLNKKNCDNHTSPDILFIGWINRFETDFLSFIKNYQLMFQNIYQDFWYLNYGKYELINRVIDFSKKYHDYDFLLYMDHDVYLDFNSVNLFINIQNLQRFTIDGKTLGMIAFNQTQDIRHQNDIFENKIMCDDLELVYPSKNGAIASGSFIIHPDRFATMVHFDKLSIYGLDDYYLTGRLLELNYINVVISNISIVHPFDSDHRYSVWKKNHLLKLINCIDNCHGHKNDSMYSIDLQESINFWNNISTESNPRFPGLPSVDLWLNPTIQ